MGDDTSRRDVVAVVRTGHLYLDSPVLRCLEVRRLAAVSLRDVGAGNVASRVAVAEDRTDEIAAAAEGHRYSVAAVGQWAVVVAGHPHPRASCPDPAVADHLGLAVTWWSSYRS